MLSVQVRRSSATSFPPSAELEQYACVLLRSRLKPTSPGATVRLAYLDRAGWARAGKWARTSAPGRSGMRAQRDNPPLSRLNRFHAFVTI